MLYVLNKNLFVVMIIFNLLWGTRSHWRERESEKASPRSRTQTAVGPVEVQRLNHYTTYWPQEQCFLVKYSECMFTEHCIAKGVESTKEWEVVPSTYWCVLLKETLTNC